MALITGMDPILANTDSVSDWLQRTNELSELMKGGDPSVGAILHANTGIANTDGNARLHGLFTANTFVVYDEIGGGSITNTISGSYSASDWTLDVLKITSDVVIANTTFTTKTDLEVSNGDITIAADDRKLMIGDGLDLQLYHNGTNSFIENNNGILYLQSNTITLQSDNSETFIRSTVNSSVELFHNNIKKLETTASGINVDGLVKADDLEIDGDGYISGNTHLGSTSTAGYKLQVTGDAFFSGLVTAGNGLDVTGDLDVTANVNATNINATNFIGDGSQLTNVSAGNVTVTANAGTANLYFTLVSGDGVGQTLYTDSDSGLGYDPSSNTLYVDNLNVGGSLGLPGTVTFTNLTVTGSATLNNLTVNGISANGAAFVGDNGTVASSSSTEISSFDAADSKGFKFLVQGHNDDPDSAYFCEVGGAHNGADVFFTRYGEISNNFDTTLNVTYDTNTDTVELYATCPSASGSNTHTFNIVIIQTVPQ